MRKLYPTCLLLFLLCSFSFAQEKEERIYYGPEKAVIGSDFVDTFLQDTLKQSHRISDFLDGKRYLLLDFWQLNCGPCIKSIPELREIHEQHSDKIVVISINTDDHRYTFRVSTRTKGITWISLWDNKSWHGLIEKYGFQGVPGFVLISPEGKVLKTSNSYPTNGHSTALRDYLLKGIL